MATELFHSQNGSFPASFCSAVCQWCLPSWFLAVFIRAMEPAEHMKLNACGDEYWCIWSWSLRRILKLNVREYYQENETITSRVCCQRFVSVHGTQMKRTLQATSKLSLAGRFGPFCKYDMAIDVTDQLQSGVPVLPVIFFTRCKHI